MIPKFKVQQVSTTCIANRKGSVTERREIRLLVPNYATKLWDIILSP